MRKNANYGGLLGRLAIEQQDEAAAAAAAEAEAAKAAEEAAAAAAAAAGAAGGEGAGAGTDGTAAPAAGEGAAAPAAGAEGAPAPAAGAEGATGEAAPAAAPAAAEAAPEIGDNADSVETDLLEVNDGIEELADFELDMDNAVETADKLEVVQESLRDIAANGGLDRHGAKILNLYLEHLYDDVNMPAAARNTVACEAFGGTKSRTEATTLALEEIEKKVETLWDSIITFVEKGLQFFADLWKKFTDAATKLKARAEELGKAAAAVKGEAQAKTINNPKLAGYLHKGGKVEGIPAAAKEVAEAVEAVSGGMMDASFASAEGLLKALQSGDLSKLSEAVKADLVKGQTTDAAAVGLKNPGEGMTLIRGDELLGNRALVQIKAGEGATAEQVAKSGVKLGQFNSAAKAPEGGELPVLSTGDATTVAELVAKLADGVLAFNAKEGKATELKKGIIEEAKKQAAKAEGEAGGVPANDARLLAKGAAAMIDQPAASMAGYSLNTGKYLLDYVELSLKQYAAAPAAEPAKEEPKAA